MLLTMLLHSIFGCGWHHAHDCFCANVTAGSSCSGHPPDASDFAPHRHAQEPQDRLCRHSHCHHDSEESSSQHHSPHSSDCDHSVCSFLSVRTVSLHCQLLSVPLVTAFLDFDKADASALSAAAVEESAEKNLCAPAFCAQLQVWRI